VFLVPWSDQALFIVAELRANRQAATSGKVPFNAGEIGDIAVLP
jgi:hypothetical protein